MSQYPYQYPTEFDLNKLVDTLEKELIGYYRNHGPYPEAFQTHFLLKLNAQRQGEQALFNLLSQVTVEAHKRQLHLLADQPQLVEALTQARRTLLMGGMKIEGVDYTPDLRQQ